jgi:hypothetical protein
MAVNLSMLAGAGAQFFDNNGVPLAGGLVYTYTAGTTTPQAAYTTSSGSTAHTNPIVLDSAGRVPSGGEIWLTDAVAYKFVTRTSAAVLIGTYDNVTGNSSGIYAAFAASSGSSLVGFIQAGTGAVATTVQAKLRQVVSVKDFGATGDGTTDDAAAIQAAFNASNDIDFPDGTYLINTGITKNSNNVTVNFGNAILKNGGATFLFNFGTTSDTPIYEGLKIYGGKFEQVNTATTSNRNYIKVAGLKNYIIRDCYMKNVSNGGIYIEAGTDNGLVDACTVIGATAYSTIRGIWLNGSTASDYQSFYMDDASLTRNATAFPVYAVKNCRVTNCKIATGSYGIYNMNTRDCVFENNYISDFGGARGITINTYSPRAIIKNNTIVSTVASSGILVTQASSSVIIDGNSFQGDFDSGRAIQVQYLADALITNNEFLCSGSQAIDLNFAATATITGNTFFRTYVQNTRVVYALPVDRNVAGTGTYGTTATTVPGFVFENNTMSGWPCGVLLGTNTASNGNIPGWIDVVVRGNLQYKMDLATTTSEYLLRPVNTSTTQSFTVQYYDNWVFPASASIRNRPLVTGDVVFSRNDYYAAAFYVTVAASGGAITVTKSFGANFDLTVTRTSTNLSLIPRSPKGSTGGQAVPYIVGVTPMTNNFVTFTLTETTSDWTIALITSGGSALDMTSATAEFVVHLASNVS